MAQCPCRTILGGLLLLAWASLACDSAPDISVTRTDSAGVAVVTSAGGDQPLDWRFEERFRLGGAEEGPESFYSLSRGVVSTDDEGRIYVLDGSAYRVVVFDENGTYLRTLGRQGGGPGELGMPSGVAVNNGIVGVWDHGKSGLVRYGPDGTPLPGFISNAFYRGRGLALRPRGAVFTTTDARQPDNTKDALVVLDTATVGEEGWSHLTTVVSLPRPDASMHESEECHVALRLPPLFFPYVEWAPGPGGRLFVSHEARYVVDVYDGTSPVASYRRALEPRQATRALAIESLGEGITMSVGNGPPCTIPPDEVLDAWGFADEIPFVESLMVDPTGRVWVERTVVGDDPALMDVLAADGGYLGTLVDAPVPVGFLSNGDLLAIETDELDVDRLVVYRIETDPAG